MPFVRSNRSHVKKVLFNLLHNGIEAMQLAGIPLPAITVTVCTKNDRNVAQVTISDNGPGVRAQDSHRLFEPFFTTKAKGIGMGLAISRSLIEENGGQLWVEPQEGSGATFHLTLPFAT
jgi:C4-dicarboxylate-specific signal transduction histidine kinase